MGVPYRPAPYPGFFLSRQRLACLTYTGRLEGPLEEALGLLPDLAQIMDALDHGFRDQHPLTQDAIDMILKDLVATAVAQEVNKFDGINSIELSCVDVELLYPF